MAVKLFLVSGRNAAVLPKVEKKVGHSISLLGCNGSFLIEDGQLKDKHPLPNDVCLEVYNKLKNNFGIIAWFLLTIHLRFTSLLQAEFHQRF